MPGQEFVATTDAGFALRIKALATTVPLHDLDARKSAKTGDWTIYQMSELALSAIDLVTLAMDFDRGARPDHVLSGVIAAAAEQAPDRPADEHAEVAAWVLDNLLNAGNADRGFRAVYGVTGPGGYSRRHFDFKLLEETYGADGELYLRASNEAVNVLVGALDVDIESAQIAADLRLEVLIRRGKLSEAQAAAQAARYQTIRYGEMLRLHLDATTRDVRNVDWVEEMPKFLSDALGHIEERTRTESAILLSITETRDTADTEQRKEQAARLVELVRECLRRHAQLQRGLQDARGRFRAEQDRQTFTINPAAAVALDLHGQLLVPTLRLPVQAASAALDGYFRASVGLDVPLAPRLIDLYDGLTTPPVERDMLGEEITEPELEEITEPERFNEATYAALDRLLALDPDAPQRLSGLLEQARDTQERAEDVVDLPLLTVVRVLALAAQEIGAARNNQERHVMVAVDDGTPLNDPDFVGSDLLVARAGLLPAAHTPDTDPSAEPRDDDDVQERTG
ncbi:hypothetical protein SAMN05443575_1562 [Jatrophihabitans endophyticus]|uniref:Uncharacterized protein n=1 Tax=Jatrophihabitans endophyticus TaxID=1206085 RepID=A0A1M5HLQ2_9ACTN|nr:hypothetical protein [Jatrophihabitans endophyticus]SHG16879.1 hypothetical protein SAMN05443575_1562 [Jatrophihabitans endophyticus]